MLRKFYRPLRNPKVFNRSIIPLLLFMPLLLLLTGCPYEYSPSAIILPQHIRKIGLRPIKNNTAFFGLEDKFMLRLQQEFTQGGQYPRYGAVADKNQVCF